jgi:hypothetical protein
MQRMPADGSDVSLTALAIRALHVYMPGSESRIARGRAYLEQVDATTNEDLVYQLLGLHWAGATDLAALAAKLVARQRADGSFAQLEGLVGDPYATAQAIVALREAAHIPASDPAIQRAVKFLLAHQVTDGSWFVATRALRFQPFFNSGFPPRSLAIQLDHGDRVVGDGALRRSVVAHVSYDVAQSDAHGASGDDHSNNWARVVCEM